MRGASAGGPVYAIAAPKSIFVLKPSSLGDIVHTLPAVARLKSAWPECKIAWLINAEWAPLLADNPDTDEIVIFPRQEFRGLGWARRLVPWLQARILGRRPDLALDFQGLLRSALIGRLSRPRRFYGLSNAREGAGFFYDRAVPLPGSIIHAVDRYLALADEALAPWSVPGWTAPPPRFPLPPGERPMIEGADLQPDFILLHPFARGAGKSLNADQVRAFCERLDSRQLVIVGGSGVAGGIDSRPGVVNLLGRTTLPELIWLLRRAAFVISVDSGPMHLAAALGRPVAAIHTWSDPRRVGPYRADAWVWKNGRLLQVGDLANADEALFGPATETLSTSHIHAICALATSS